MVSIYDTFADSCTALAAKTKRKSDQLRLLQLAGQWRTVVADRHGPGKGRHQLFVAGAKMLEERRAAKSIRR
jgi:hypothetical protein